MCSCLTEKTESVRTLVKEKIERENNVHSWKSGGEFENVSMFFNGQPSRFFHVFSIEFLRTKSNGKPEARVKKESTNILASFCPFCGEKYPELKT